MRKRIDFRPTLLTLLALFSISGLDLSDCLAQGTKADYQRMRRQMSLGNNLVHNTRITPNWLEDSDAMWYQTTDVDRTIRYQLVRMDKKTNQTIFTNKSVWDAIKDQVPKKLQNEAKKRMSYLKLSFNKPFSKAYFLVDDIAFEYHIQNKKFKKTDAKKLLAKKAKKAISVQPSQSGTSSASLKVLNKTGKDVEIFWVDTRSSPTSYGTIKAGGEYNQNTYIGHNWLVRSKADGQNLAYFSVDNQRDVVTVNKNDKVKLRIVGREISLMEFYKSGNVGYKKTKTFKKPTPAFSRRTGRNSLDGKWRVETRDRNVVLVNRKTKKETKLSTDGTSENYYNGTIYWAPDSKHFIALQETPAQRHTVSFVESSPRQQLQPKLHSFNYLKPGDKVRVLRPQLFSVGKKKQIPVSNKLFKNPYAMSRMGWKHDSSEFSFLYNQRGHQVLRYVGINTKGTAREIAGDEFDTFIHYSAKTYLNHLKDTNEVIWASERDGWNHLYLYDAKTGEVKNQITKGNWVMREVNRVDTGKRQIWFTASGIREGQDPYYIHYCRVNFDGSNLVVMTEGDGTHRISYSPSGKYFIDRYSRVDMPPVSEIRKSSDGSKVCLLEKSDWSKLKKAGWQAPERFVAKGRDGETDIHGVIYRPSNFDPKKTYPVIEYIYAGPHNSFVPKSFGPFRWEKSLAELGFIIVQIDGMGTNNRGKKFHDYCWKNLGDSGFPDRILWMKAAAKKYPQMDISKVGIFGGSAGGQSSTRALLAFGDFYKVAVSDCGCHDNRMDKIWWNEQWMGWPIGDHYKEQSNVTQAKNLKGDLFLIVGEVDRNVDPASTMQVVDALIKADKDFDLLVVPGGGHGVGWTRYGKRRTADYFVRKILGVEPRRN